MARMMLYKNDLPRYFWAEAINTACYVTNRAMLRPILKKTPYELYKGKKLVISYFKPFSCKCFILINGKENTEKFDSKSDKGIFLGYSRNSRAYRIFNRKSLTVEESTHVIFVESIPMPTPHMNGDENDASITLRNQTQTHDFLDGAKSEDQVEEVLPPSQEAGTQGDEAQLEDLQLPSSSHHDLLRT